MKKTSSRLMLIVGTLMVSSAITISSIPKQVYAESLPFTFSLFSYSNSHSMVYSYDDTVFVKGQSSNWALLGRDTSLTTPTNRTNVVGLQTGETIIDLEVGDESNMFLTSNQRLLISGINKEGQLGNDTTLSFFGQDTPLDITSFLDLAPEETITNLIATKSTPEIHTVITSDNRILLWGSNPVAVSVDTFVDYVGNVGKNPTGRTDVELFKTPEDVTTLFADLNAGNVVDMIYRIQGGLAITDTQALITWGKNVKGLLGNNETDLNYLAATPIKIDLSTLLNEDELVLKALMNNSIAYGLTNQNRILVWGDNDGGYAVKDGPSNILEPVIYDLTGVTLAEDETIIDMIMVDRGLMLLTSLGEIWFNGYTPLLTYASASINNPEVLTDYRANPTWINQTEDLPVLPEGEIVSRLEGFSGSYLFITNEGNLITQYYFGSPQSLIYGTNAQRVVGKFAGARYRVYIGDATVAAFIASPGDQITLPSQGVVAPEGYYLAGWSLSKNAANVSFPLNQSFNFSFDTNTRFFPVFIQGVDPNASTSAPSSSSASSPSSSSASSSNTPVSSSLPGSSQDGETPTPRSPLFGIIVSVIAVGGLGTFSWFFFFKNLSIGGFSFVALKKWWAALGKRDKKDKDKE
jgi:hypothetical protein